MKKEKKSTTKEQTLSAEHIKSYRINDMHMNQREFADLIGREKQMVARYEKGEARIPREIIDRLVSLSGWIREYWEGLTDCKTWDAFTEECESTESEKNEIIEGHKARRQAQIRTLLNTCGFGYEHYSPGFTNYDYLMVMASDSPEVQKTLRIIDAGFPHKITAHQDGDQKDVFFSDAEMSGLLAEISDMISFRCYQKSLREISIAPKDTSSN